MSFEWPPWEELAAEAGRIVEQTRLGLPKELRPLADRVPVTLLPVPDQAMEQDGLAPDLLGLFVGADTSSDASSPAPLPAQILLFLDNVWDYADGDWAVFREEVRTTYLHELGHYLGWDEDDLELRGLG